MRHIFFDLDNTLWDHRKNALLTLTELFERKQISEIYQLSFQDFHTQYDKVNERLWEMIRDGEIDKDYLRKHRFYDTFLHFGIDDFQLAQYFEYRFLDEIIAHNELVEGSIEILNYLKNKGYTLHIISNGFGEVTHRKIEDSGLSSYFNTITSADDVGVRKPNPKIYDHALGLANAHKSESMLIGDDWIADALGSYQYGMKSIFFNVLNQDYHHQDIVKIDHLREIKNWL